MYSRYSQKCGKHHSPSVQIDENEYYYADDGIKTKNDTLFSPTFNSNFREYENMINMPKRCQEFQGLSKETYDYDSDEKLDDDFDFHSQKPLSQYRGHINSYQYHDHYNHKANEYEYVKQAHQREQLHAHKDHSFLYHRSKKNYCDDAYGNIHIPPASVHDSRSVNNNFNCNNNNIQYKKSNESFIGEHHHHHHHQSLPRAECLQLKSLDQVNPNLPSEQHYQHYYSYFYNQNIDSSVVERSSGRGRKLPTTHKMPFPKKSVHSTESQLNAKYDLISVEADNFNDIENNPRPNYNFVLKEKSANNNDVVSGFDKSSIDILGDDRLGLKQFKVYENENPQNIDKEDSEAALLYLQQYKNKRKFQGNFEEDGAHFYYNNQTPDVEVDNVGTKVDTLNIYEKVKRQQKQDILSVKDDTCYRNIKLPSTPIKAKAVTKKCSPPSKNRRVLIYNIQSPRLSRLSPCNIRTQKSKVKFHNDVKDNTKNTNVDMIFCENNYVVDDAVHVFNSACYVKDSRTTICDDIKKKNESKDEDNKNSSDEKTDDDDDDDDDDDFDNVSDFDSSSDSDISSDSEEGYRSYAYKLTHSLDVISTSLSLESSINSESDSLDNPNALLVPSLFPNVPPYLAFSSNIKKGPEIPSDLYRILKWRVTNVMPRVVRSILANSGMRLLKKTNEWMGVWGKHMKSPCFKTIRPYQKINHLPGSFKIGRKDSCWKNLVKLMAKHGKKDFGFMPKTYIIPNDLKQLRKNWPKYAQKNVKWIIKPPASARGTGIRVVDRWAQIPKRKPLIVQKYIERPLLINGSKFDLRLYVLVTSINPLRVYMYHNGLARFASVKYSDKSDTLNDRCMHLTNYSINKFSSNYSRNEDVNACHGHKWTIKSLWTYLNSRGVRTDLLWAALRSLVLRTILAGENSINNMIRANVESKYSCFELFGFDVLLDADLVPWLLEVNISPSLHSELPLDSHVKAPLVQSVLNTALYNIPPKIPIERQREIAMEMSLPPGPICYDKRMYINYLSRTEKIKHNTFTRKSMEERDEYVNAILEHLTPDDIRCLVIAEDELARCTPLERIFPTIDTYKYLKYTEAPRYYNRLLDAWESRYANNRTEGIHLLRQYCEDQYHLQVPQIPTKKPLNYRTRAMIKNYRSKSALTIASSNYKWRELRRKLQISHINSMTSSTELNSNCNSQINDKGEETETETETEEESTD